MRETAYSPETFTCESDHSYPAESMKIERLGEIDNDENQSS